MVEAQRRPESRNLLWVGLGVLLLLLVALGVWAIANRGPTTATVARRDVVGYLPVEGEVVAPPGKQAAVMAPWRAPVERVLAAVGQKVDRGDVLVELSQPAAKQAYEQARMAVREAEAALAAARRTYGADLAAARQQLEAARRAEQAARRAAVPPPPGPPAEAGAEPAEAPPVAVTEAGVGVEAATQARIAAEQAVAQAQAALQAELVPYQTRLEQARAMLREAQSGAKMAMIRAPISGTVLALNAEPGQEIGVDAKQPVATIVDLDSLQVQGRITSEHLSSVKKGTPVLVSAQSLPNQQLEGQVVAVIPDLSEGRGAPRHYRVLASFRNERGLLKPGAKVTLAMKTGEARDVLAVPKEALDTDAEGRPTVQVLRGQDWQTVVVTPGITDGEYTAIRSGLKEGDVVRL